MTQTNVNASGNSDRVIEREGFSMGMISAIVLGVVLLALIAWYAVTQTSLFGTAYAPGTNNVNVTQNQPSGSSGQTGSTSGGTTGGSTTGSSSGAARYP
jgi:hypothetical protein